MCAVYFIEHGAGGPVKIGRATDPVRRLRSMQTSTPEELRLLAVAESENDALLEAELHAAFRRDRLRGEWFERSARLEEVIADAREATAMPGSFDELLLLDDRLARLAAEVGEFARQAPRLPTVCSEDAWRRRFEPRLDRLIGWTRRGDAGGLMTRAAYDEAERGLRELMPRCRGCLCGA